MKKPIRAPLTVRGAVYGGVASFVAYLNSVDTVCDWVIPIDQKEKIVITKEKL